MAGFSRRKLTAAALQLLQVNAPLVNRFAGGPPSTPPLDPDGRVHMYAVLWPAPGSTTQDRLTATVDGLLWQFQVTCVGGDVDRANACVDFVTAALAGNRLVIDGMRTGKVRQIGDSGPVTEDRTADPSRWTAALIYQLHVTRTRSP